MFRMEKIRGASAYGAYVEQHLDYSDYVGEKQRVLGEWFGNLREEFGISGASYGSKDQAFRALCEGQHPQTGEPLAQRQKEDAVRFFDFQADTPKSVSIMAVTMGDERLVEAHVQSVRIALVELEKFAAYRSGELRLPQTTGQVVGAMFTHKSARPDAGGGPADPQLHTHCAIANVTKGSDGRYYGLTEVEMLRAIRYAGKVYENEMVKQIVGLGYKVEYRHGPNGVIEGFEIAGVSKEVMERFSKRSHAVEKAIAQFKEANGFEPPPAVLRIIKRETRGEKELSVPEEILLDQQKAQLSRDELEKLLQIQREANEKLLQPSSNVAATESQKVDAIEALGNVIEHMYERESVISRHSLVAEALAQNLGRVDATELRAASESHKELVPLVEGSEKLLARVATVEGLKDELRAIRTVRKGEGSEEPYVKGEAYKAFGGQDSIELNGKAADVSEQRAVADGVLASPDKYLSLRGVAGAGKTTVLPEIDKGLKFGGYRPLYLAPTATARDELKAQGFKADTLQQFLAEQENPLLRLPAKTVLVVDESGLASNRQGMKLIRAVEKNDARVIFVGDVKQHTAVEAGDFLRILEEHAPIKQFTLGKIQRQKVEKYRTAMQQAARGNSRAAVEALDAIGWLKEGKADYLGNAARELVALRIEHGASKVLGVSPTHDEGRAMTSIVRKEMHSRGMLGSELNRRVFDSYNWTTQQRLNLENYRAGNELTVSTGRLESLKQNETATVVGVDTAKKTLKLMTHGGDEITIDVNRKTVQLYQVGELREIPIAPGDVIIATANDKRTKVTNGDLLTVDRIQEDGKILTKEGRVLAGDFRHFNHGYVITSNKSQGKTVDHVVVAAERLSPKAAYVALSRGRQSAALHTVERERLIKLMSEVNQGRSAATDFRQVPPDEQRRQVQRSINSGQNLPDLSIKPQAQPALSTAPQKRITPVQNANQVRVTFWKALVEKANRAATKTRVNIRKASRYLQEQTQRHGNHQNRI